MPRRARQRQEADAARWIGLMPTPPDEDDDEQDDSIDEPPPLQEGQEK